MFSFRSSVSKFLINLRQQFRVHKLFLCIYVKHFVHKFLWDLQSFHFVFRITLSKMRKLLSCPFIKGTEMQL